MLGAGALCQGSGGWEEMGRCSPGEAESGGEETKGPARAELGSRRRQMGRSGPRWDWTGRVAGHNHRPSGGA